MIRTIIPVRAWNPLEWLEEPIQDPLYLRIRMGDEFARELTPYNILQSARNYFQADRTASNQTTILDQTIRGSAWAHLAELFRRLAIEWSNDSRRYGRYLIRAGGYLERSAEFYRLARDDHRLGVVARLHAWIQVRRECWEEALRLYSEAYRIFDNQGKNLRYLGKREKITTYRQWMREIEKEFEETNHQMMRSLAARSPRDLPKERIFINDHDKITHVWVNGKLCQTKDLDNFDHSIYLTSENRYEIHEVVDGYEEGSGIVKGDWVLVEVPLTGRFIPRKKDLIAIIVDSKGIKGIKCRRVEVFENTMLSPAPDELSQAIGKVVTILKKAA